MEKDAVEMMLEGKKNWFLPFNMLPSEAKCSILNMTEIKQKSLSEWQQLCKVWSAVPLLFGASDHKKSDTK